MELTGPNRDFVGYGRRAPKAVWPEGAQVAINLVLVYEEGAEYSIPDGGGRNDAWGETSAEVDVRVRDLGTETHYEYGSRAGIWRLAHLFDRAGIPVTVSACAAALERNPDVAGWMVEREHDVLGHGLRWTEPWTQTRDEERAHLHRAIDRFGELLGERPLGWNARTFPSVYTREPVVEEGGFVYYSDPCNDDLPYFADVAGTPLLVVPYSKVLNDARYLTAPGFSSPQDFVDNCRFALDYLLEEADERGGRMMTVCVHARWSGQPSRAAAVRDFIAHAAAQPAAIFMRRIDIARWWLAHHDEFDRPGLPTQ
ncbi:MAG: polysaccharide deacetylase family protein [Gaiellaceae bacterium]